MRTIARALLTFSLLTGGASAARAQDATPAPAEAWELSAGVASQGIFDPGIHLFSRSSWIRGAEVVVRRSTARDGLSFAPETGYAFEDGGRDLAPKTSAELLLHRVLLGARASYPIRRGVRAYVHGGAIGIAATADFHDAYHGHTRTAFAGGGFAAGGLSLDLTPRVLVSIEAGHSVTTSLRYGSWGSLDVNGANAAGSIGMRF